MDYSSGARLYTHPKLIITIEDLNGNNYIKETWKGILNPIVFRDLVRNSLNIYEKHLPQIKVPHLSNFFLLGDSRELERIRDEEVDWFIEKIYPEYEKLGFTHHAIIEPLSEYASGKDDEVVNTDESYEPFKVKVFKKEQEAFDWFSNDLRK